MENKKDNSREDLITLRNYAIGVVGFATTISAILIQVLHFRAEPTIVCVGAFAIMMLLVVYLINKAENRNVKRLSVHMDNADTEVKEMRNDLDEIKSLILENGKSTLRIEINEEMLQNPHNHDTILKMAERYFCEMKGDWYMTNRFLDWVEKEHVHLPPSLTGLKRD